MDLVWASLRDFAAAHLPAATRRLRQKARTQPQRNATSGMAHYLGVARTLLDTAERTTLDLIREAAAVRANASRSTTEQQHAFRARVHTHLKGESEATPRRGSNPREVAARRPLSSSLLVPCPRRASL